MENHSSKFKCSLKDRAFQYSLLVIRFLEALPRDATTYVIGKQLLRSATSIGANIIEAQAGSSKRDFTNFMNHALKSANESLYWVRLVIDAKEIGTEIA